MSNTPKDDEKVLNLIKEMSHMTIFLNKLSSAQVKSMQSYPFIYFNGVNNIELDYNLESIKEDGEPTKGASYVKYFIYLDPFADNNNMPYRLKTLEDSIKSLFWKEVNVEVYINDELKHKSK